jgi:hypothetical protein
VAAAYSGAGSAAALAECVALIGGNLACGNGDPAVAHVQQCPPNVAVPDPFTGGLAGNTLANADAALQSTCTFAAGVQGSLPGQTQVMEYKDGTSDTLTGLNDDAYGLGDNALVATCMFLVADGGCNLD